jgi:radical SAM/Cys-rich protein
MHMGEIDGAKPLAYIIPTEDRGNELKPEDKASKKEFSMNAFEARVVEHIPDKLCSAGIEALQVNLGRLCNLSCTHCHLECSPKREELMGSAAMENVIEVAATLKGALIDITGGLPEMHPRFKDFISALRSVGGRVQSRTNITVLLEPEYEGMIEFLYANQVNLVASMPCYLEDNVRAQRGDGVYAKSVDTLRALNNLGYGTEHGPTLDLVYNPGGATLPGCQATLEEAYRSQLQKRFGITFNRLLTITNMPIGRFLKHLQSEGNAQSYMQLLKDAFNPGTLPSMMCRSQICVDWDGRLYDCDFNLALGLSLNHSIPNRIEDFDLTALANRVISTGEHCFGCAAGHGSSCGGALL